MQKEDFIFGAQYYRAPTPSSENWETDLKNIKENGFNSVKFWVQWRWTHRNENEFYFDDIDRLMDLAYKYNLRVTLNVIFDVAPQWIFKKYPDCKIVLADGRKAEPHAECHRQIGGFPSTCYSHKEAFKHRMNFLSETVKRYKDHPAMHMWDVWNEPEQCGPYRMPRPETLSCFCKNCRREFINYVSEKYESIDKMNEVWGRCYNNFDETELPMYHYTFSDFLDFREYSLDKMTNEANARINCVKKIDKTHQVYLHVVPNTSSIFNALTGVDDFALAKNCDVFASTNFASPIWSVLTTSAGKGKICYNVECHIGNGSTKMHQKQIELKDMVKDLVPQIGMGIRGFMFWQYRPEVLGLESPAWGVTKPDGTMGSVGAAAKEFWKRINPYIEEIMNAAAPQPEIAIWKGRKNEILSFCINGELGEFADSIENYVNAVYYNNYNCCIVDDEGVKNGLEGIKMLFMPMCYELNAEVADAVDKFVLDGGTLFCEAHLGGYDADCGRHSYRMPGLKLDERWNIHEIYTTSSYHLKIDEKEIEFDDDNFNDDVKKAMEAYGLSGGKCFPVKTTFGITVAGAERFAYLECDDGEVIGKFDSMSCMIRKNYGKGTIYYCGTNFGQGAKTSPAEFSALIKSIIKSTNIQDNKFSSTYGVHTDSLTDDIFVVYNSTDTDEKIAVDGEYVGIFSDAGTVNKEFVIPAQSAELLRRIK